MKKAASEEHGLNDNEENKVVSTPSKKRQLKSNDDVLEPTLKKLKREKVLPKLQLFHESESNATIVDKKNKVKKLKPGVNVKESKEGKGRKEKQHKVQVKQKVDVKRVNYKNVLDHFITWQIYLHYM